MIVAAVVLGCGGGNQPEYQIGSLDDPVIKSLIDRAVGYDRRRPLTPPDPLEDVRRRARHRLVGGFRDILENALVVHCAKSFGPHLSDCVSQLTNAEMLRIAYDIFGREIFQGYLASRDLSISESKRLINALYPFDEDSEADEATEGARWWEGDGEDLHNESGVDANNPLATTFDPMPMGPSRSAANPEPLVNERPAVFVTGDEHGVAGDSAENSQANFPKKTDTSHSAGEARMLERTLCPLAGTAWRFTTSVEEAHRRRMLGVQGYYTMRVDSACVAALEKTGYGDLRFDGASLQRGVGTLQQEGGVSILECDVGRADMTNYRIRFEFDRRDSALVGSWRYVGASFEQTGLAGSLSGVLEDDEKPPSK